MVGRHFNSHPSFQGTFAVRTDVKLPLRKKHRTYSLSDPYRREGLNGVHYQLDILPNRSINWRCNPEIEPSPENRIVLSGRGKDFFGNPVPSVILGYSRSDKRTIQRCKAFLTDNHRELSTSPLKRHFKWRGHPAGTIRMGHSEIDGVVDPNNKMFGIANLYVSGACTFPTSGTSNPTNTVVAMTLRLADHILEKG